MSKKVLTTTEINKIIRQEGLCGNNRLPSFGLARDLSLGGTKAKRNYTPNFNAARSKDKTNGNPVVKNERFQKPNTRAQKRSHDGSRNQTKFVETEGVFSEGMGKATPLSRNSYSVKSSSTKDRQSVDALVLPRISSTDFMIKEEEDDYEPSHKLKYDGDIKFDADDNIFQALRVVESVTYEFNGIDKPLVKIKKEERNGDSFRTTYKYDYQKTRSNFSPREASPKFNGHSAFTPTKGTFSDDKPTFSLFKFPDSLMGFLGAENESLSNLSDLPEGQFGTLVIRKSGKMEMVANNVRYNVMQDKFYGHHQAMMFPGEESMSTEPALVTLGTVTEKYTVIPNWQILFKKTISPDAQ